MEEQLLGRYKIIRQIGRGVAAVVYEAFDTQLQRPVALKVLSVADNLTGMDRRQAIERFYREASAAGRISHPNIAQIYDVGEEKGKHFIAMELCQGVTLRDRLQFEGRILEARLKKIVIQILEALRAAHAAGIIHRDIKPENIIIGQDDRVKLTDFGIAKVVSDITLTQSGMILGTPAYMSPEQVLGKGVDARSDIFSVGVVLYECLSGRKPFDGDNITAVTHKIVSEAPPPLRGVSSPWPEIIMKALSKSASDRYQSAAEMLSDILTGRTPNQTSHNAQTNQGQLNQTVYASAPPQPPKSSVGGQPPASGPYPNPAQDIPDNLIWSILATILFCVPFGIVAIVKAVEANSKKEIGDYHGAFRAYQASRQWALIAVVAGLCIGFVYGFLCSFLALE